MNRAANATRISFLTTASSAFACAGLATVLTVGGLACGGGDSNPDGGNGNGDGASGDAGADPDAAISDCTPATGTALDTELVATDLIAPVFVTHANDQRLFIIEQPGRIRIVEDGVLLPTPFLDLSSAGLDRVVFAGDERGLLGLAFHPNYSSNGRFFVHYSAPVGPQNADSRIAEYTVSSDPNVANTTEREVLTQEQFAANHNGGMIEFGPDGMLYIALGDGGGRFDPNNHGQNTASKLAAILRIDVADDSAPGYAIPADNPFATAGGAPEVWSYGWRNPWRFSFDPQSDDMWVGDVGQNCLEEISVSPSGQAGLNFGWSTKEGGECLPPQGNCNFPAACGDTSGMVEPILTYAHNGGARSVTGGYLYRGGCIPDVDGWYFFADYELSEVYALDSADATPTRMTIPLPDVGQVTSFGRDVFGELYVVSIGGTGNVHRITAAP